jgi:oxygen-independent coproporphyrinogen-3 oxidase
MISEQTRNLIAKYGGPVPRYTSYPTAVQFHEGFAEADTVSCLKALQPGEEISLYVHIPFCHSLCHYCGCHTKIVNHTDVITAYIKTLCHEILLAAAHLPKDIHVSRIHFGGGSPNYAPVEDLERILDTVKAAFPGSTEAQIDMECDPRLLDAVKITQLARLGIQRVSLGIQDFDEGVQNAVHRIQPLEHIIAQVESLRDNHIESINFDLIVGLPRQTRKTILKTVAETIKIGPPRIAVFAYAHVPWMKAHQKLLEKYNFPTPEDRFVMQDDIKARLCDAGYRAIGIDHYALPGDALETAQRDGTLRRNFQGYTDDRSETVLGFGLSAISQFKGAYSQNTLDAPSYRKAVESGHLPVIRGYALSKQDITEQKAVMQVMCRFAIDLRDYPGIFIAHAQLARLEQDGLIRRNHDMIEVTETGKPFVRVVAACFDSYYQNDHYKKDDRHAKAI